MLWNKRNGKSLTSLFSSICNIVSLTNLMVHQRICDYFSENLTKMKQYFYFITGKEKHSQLVCNRARHKLFNEKIFFDSTFFTHFPMYTVFQASVPIFSAIDYYSSLCLYKNLYHFDFSLAVKLHAFNGLNSFTSFFYEKKTHEVIAEK